MKKLLYVAVMALTMGFFASCNNSPSTSVKYEEGQNPTINAQDGTVNGKAYDNTVEKCWELSMAIKAPGYGNASETSYVWGTEWFVVSVGEASVATWNHQGIAAGYEYKGANAADYETCKALDDED